jgi:ABC-type dipeptide/oligopeptide/nickel transport system permease component/ABC-type transport system substrate-binding protein
LLPETPAAVTPASGVFLRLLKSILRNALSLAGALAGLLLAAGLLGGFFVWLQPSGTTAPSPPPLATAAVSPDSPSGETPLLAALVAAGRLPPAAERTGPNPLVLPGRGTYGGTWFRASDSIGQALFDISFRLAGATLVRWSPDGRQVVPALAESWRHDADYRRWEFTLRRGVRWSDGEPLTTRDVDYMYRHEILPEYVPVPGGLAFRGRIGRLTVLDERRFAVEFDDPNPLMLERLASDYEGLAQPAHYLARFHPELGEPAFIAAETRRRNLGSPRQLYAQVRELGNPAHPRLWPWIVLERPEQSPVKAVRNPYYWAVDETGRQLPYLDQVVIDIRAPRMIALAAAHGQLTFQEQFLELRDYSYLRAMEARGLCRVYGWESSFGARWTIYPNLNRRVTADDPASPAKARLLADARFRRAVSLALDRAELIRVNNLGFGEPGQISPPVDSPYFDVRLRNAAIRHDPTEANRLLDALGLTARDAEGCRTFPDGTRMAWYLDWNELGGVPPAMLVEQLRAAGLRFVLRQRSTALFEAERAGGLQDFIGGASYPDIDPAVFPMAYLPTSANCYFAYHYGLWFATGGLWGGRTREVGIEPPPGTPVRRALELHDLMTRTPDAAQRHAVFREIAAIAAEELWSISVLPQPPALVVAAPNLRNVPAVAMQGFWQATPANAGAEAFWLEGATTDAGLAAWVKAEWNRPGHEAGPGETAPAGRVPWRAVIGGGLLAALALGAWRSAYVARRLAIMVPSLVIVSLAVFTIVQWPPGSFVEAKQLQLAAVGRDYAEAEIRLLQEQFHLDDPTWKQYLRWSGLHWFASFRAEDRGLLQGELGRSMENGRPIADILGERLLITFVLAFATLVFTWALAVPLGLYSAARAGGWGDRVIGMVGFLAVSIPGFLLALLLLFLGNRLFGTVSVGLFSPEFAAQPGWSAGKVADLLKNIWLPLAVLGLGGTAGMIRLLRTNVIEELRRPFVQAARARGMRPVPLLLKYPLRVALNPFASGIGAVFPYLVSGEVIVATLLSLPTIGPVLLTALLSQDVYLAASIIMLLTVLAMAGTLVSDLLLVWLDPRIRLGGRS